MWQSFVVEPARYALASTMMVTGLPEATRIRWITVPKCVLGGILGNLYHRLRIPFELTPLFSLPLLALGAYFLYAGPLWLGVACCAAHGFNDMADGVAMGLYMDATGTRPAGRMRIRRFLDSYISDVVSRFVLYLVFVLRLHEAHLVHPMLLLALVIIEIMIIMQSSEAEKGDRRMVFHYEYVLAPGAGRRLFGPTYGAQVVIGQLTSYQNYVLAPLLGYVWPIATHGAIYFGLLLGWRVLALVSHLKTRMTQLALAA